ncbi:sterigmatocystin 8-O-methyltransferase [Stachybotrys elegans]|uniref:Sterigmatocystin 8-O-methyltransferase n=1 Tax=Stachybotrys elegans TaxID=80388 RepID=A0A8K0WJ51_9HYPO|nr:sterigmatocystin 8-O-methyltransferase [Stachybotrys elegans]
MASATDLITQLNSLGQRISDGDQKARALALKVTEQLSTSLSDPTNVAVDLAFSPFIAVAARIAVNLGLFKIISEHEGSIDSKQLSALSGAEELLIIRILRPLSAIGFVKEVGEKTWEASPVSRSMAKEEIAAGHRMIGEMVVGAAQKAPKFLQEYGSRCPSSPHDGLMQYAFQTKLTAFELFATMPSILKDFNLFMGNTMGAREYWVDWYPVQAQLLDGHDGGTALLIDVGGGKGHDLIAFHQLYKGRGRLVLQDLAPVIDGLHGLDPAIEAVKYDFFTPQPIIGARAYFYHHILHDWSDENCVNILKQVKLAMAPGYSKLLLHEMIVPDVGASKFHAMLDMTMMAFNAGMERTETQWKTLLESVGFEVTHIWPAMQEDADGIIEAMIKV